MLSSATLNPGGFAVNGILAAIRSIYHIAGDINAFLDEHIDKMKVSENTTISRTGRVLEGAKYGFGIGYTVPITIISLGQLLLGLNKAAIVNVGSAALLSNPVAMTCAALGAVYYGWNALSEQEKVETIESLRQDLDVGAELIKSIVQFVISKTNELLSSENLKELKKFIGDAAHAFGKNISDVTGAVKDKVIDAYFSAKLFAEDTGLAVKGHASEAYKTVLNAAGEAGDSIHVNSSQALETVQIVAAEVGNVISKKSENLLVTTKNIVSNVKESAKDISEDASQSIKAKLGSNDSQRKP